MTVPAALELARAMRSRRYLRVWALTMLLVGVWHGAAVAAPAAPDHASVLILLPGQPGLQAATAITTFTVPATVLACWKWKHLGLRKTAITGLSQG